MIRNPHSPKDVLFSFLMIWEMPAAAVHRVVHSPYLVPSHNKGACALCGCEGSFVFASRLLCISEQITIEVLSPQRINLDV